MNQFFNRQEDDNHRHQTEPQGAKPLQQLIFIRPQKRFRVVFGLKRPRMSVENFFFARLQAKLPTPPLFSITGSGKRRQDVLTARLLPYFPPATFNFFLKVKSELASCLLTQGTFKKKVQGVAPTIATEELTATVLQQIERSKKYTYC